MIDSYFLPYLLVGKYDPMSNEESYRVLLFLIEKIFSMVSTLSLTQNPPIFQPPYQEEFFKDVLPPFIKYWKLSQIKESEKLYISNQTDFDFLKGRFVNSIKNNHGQTNFHLIPLIYWSLNFRFSNRYKMELLASFSDPRDVVLIMICSDSILSLSEKENIAKLLFTDASDWYLRRQFFNFFEDIRYSLYNSIPLELLRKNDLTDWNNWLSNFDIVVKSLQKLDKIGFSGLARQVIFLQERQLTIQSIRQSYKDQFEKLLETVDPDASASLGAFLKPVFELLKQMKKRCEKDGNDYSEGLRLDGKLPSWLLDLTNSLICIVSNSFDLLDLKFPFEEQMCSLKDIQKFYDSIVKSPGKNGFFGIFNNLNILIDMIEVKQEHAPTQESLSTKIPSKISPLADNPFSFDLDCSHFSSNEIQSEFGVDRGEFIIQLDQYFRSPKVYEKSIREKFSKNSDQALEYGKIEISFNQKFKFWHTQSSFLLTLQRLFRPQNLTNIFSSWDSFISDFKNLLNSQNAKAAEYPSIKINFFAKVYLTKKFISNENEYFALKTVNRIFRLLERLIDSNTDIKEVEKNLEKVLILPLFFLQAEEQNPAEISVALDEYSYCKLADKFQPDFSKYFKSETPRGFEIAFVNLFDKIKRDIKAENLVFDPVLVMEFGRDNLKSSIRESLSSCHSEIVNHLESFRNAASQDRKVLHSSLQEFNTKLLEFVRREDVKNDAQYRNIRCSCRYILTSSHVLDTHPMLKSLEKLFRSLDDAIYLDQNPEPIINDFVETQLRPLIPKD
jgi:hypothetical protein